LTVTDVGIVAVGIRISSVRGDGAGDAAWTVAARRSGATSKPVRPVGPVTTIFTTARGERPVLLASGTIMVQTGVAVVIEAAR
jgi:hypothetical protein